MRLLSQNEGKSQQLLTIEEQQRRSLELDSQIQQKRLELQALDRAHLAHLSSTGRERYEEETAWKAKIATLTEEVEQLEARRKKALVPLEEKEKELQDKTTALLQREEAVSLKESDNEYTREALERRLDEVGEREQEAIEFSGSLAIREANIRLQETDIKNRSEALTTLLANYQIEMVAGRKDIQEQKAVLKGRDVSITEREKEVARKEKSFIDRERRLQDRYRTLERAITEAKLKHNVPPEALPRDGG